MDVSGAPRIVLISRSYVKRDPRVVKQMLATKGMGNVFWVGLFRPDEKDASCLDMSEYLGDRLPGSNILAKTINSIRSRGLAATIRIVIVKMLKTPLMPYCVYKKGYLGWGLLPLVQRLKEEKPDIIIANDIDALPIAVQAKGSARLLYDAHEYSPGQNLNSMTGVAHNRRSRHVLFDYLPFVDVMSTVSDLIAAEYQREFSCPRIDIVTNATEYKELSPGMCRSGEVKLVHHGVALRQRGLDILINMMSLLDSSFSLDLYLVNPPGGNLKELKMLARRMPRVRFPDPVPMNALPAVLNGYDLGVYSLPPSCINHDLALPNKLFEFIQARLGVVVSPASAMSTFVRKYNVGVVADRCTPESFASAISGMTPNAIMEYKRNSDKHALELSAERQVAKLHQLVIEQLLEGEKGSGHNALGGRL